jgi:hypothetical protein
MLAFAILASNASPLFDFCWGLLHELTLETTSWIGNSYCTHSQSLLSNYQSAIIEDHDTVLNH